MIRLWLCDIQPSTITKFCEPCRTFPVGVAVFLLCCLGTYRHQEEPQLGLPFIRQQLLLQFPDTFFVWCVCVCTCVGGGVRVCQLSTTQPPLASSWQFSVLKQNKSHLWNRMWWCVLIIPALRGGGRRLPGGHSESLSQNRQVGTHKTIKVCWQ